MSIIAILHGRDGRVSEAGNFWRASEGCFPVHFWSFSGIVKVLNRCSIHLYNYIEYSTVVC